MTEQKTSNEPVEDIGALPADFAGNFTASIAISLKRIADMLEEDRKPRLELLPRGFETDGQKRHRQWLERMDRAHATDERRTKALEELAAAWGKPISTAARDTGGVE